MAQTSITDLQELSKVSGDELYDTIMQTIEPELLMANLPHIDEPYANETDDQHKARYQRYSAAYDTYDVRFAEWISYMKQQLNTYRRTVMSAVEAELKQQESDELSSLESAISSTTLAQAV